MGLSATAEGKCKTGQNYAFNCMCYNETPSTACHYCMMHWRCAGSISFSFHAIEFQTAAHIKADICEREQL